MDTMVSKLATVIKGLPELDQNELRKELGWDNQYIPKSKRTGYSSVKSSNKAVWIRKIEQWHAGEKGIKCFGSGKPQWIDKDKQSEIDALNGGYVVIANKIDGQYAICQHKVGSSTPLGQMHFQDFHMLCYGTKFSELSEWLVANKDRVTFEVKS